MTKYEIVVIINGALCNKVLEVHFMEHKGVYSLIKVIDIFTSKIALCNFGKIHKANLQTLLKSYHEEITFYNDLENQDDYFQY